MALIAVFDRLDQIAAVSPKAGPVYATSAIECCRRTLTRLAASTQLHLGIGVGLFAPNMSLLILDLKIPTMRSLVPLDFD
eukprot:508695-Amphidinium_carterae.2